jgi:hypothetical protein
MTATHVDGVEVIADEPAQSPITSRDGKPVHFKQIRELLLADGATVYGCVHCDYTSPGIGSIRPHLGKHKNGKDADEISLSQLLARIAEIEKVTAERDEWKARALKAEGSLKVLRDALGGGR